jgi:hypothetical protein
MLFLLMLASGLVSRHHVVLVISFLAGRFHGSGARAAYFEQFEAERFYKAEHAE